MAEQHPNFIDPESVRNWITPIPEVMPGQDPAKRSVVPEQQGVAVGRAVVKAAAKDPKVLQAERFDDLFSGRPTPVQVGPAEVGTRVRSPREGAYYLSEAADELNRALKARPDLLPTWLGGPRVVRGADDLPSLPSRAKGLTPTDVALTQKELPWENNGRPTTKS